MDAAAGGDSGAGGGGTSPPAGAQPGAAALPAAAPNATPATALAAATITPIADIVPEKHRVLGADGKIDVEATLRKNAEAYGALEKRLGSGDVAPASAADYKVTPPEALKDAFNADDPALKSFLEKAHAAKLTQAQLDVVLGSYFESAQKLAGGAAALDADGCIAELSKDWRTDEERTTNLRAAARAFEQMGGAKAQALAEAFGNNPLAIWFAAQVGAQLKESTQPGGSTPSGADDIRALEKSEAYRNPKHPEYEAVSRKVRQFYERTAAGQPDPIV